MAAHVIQQVRDAFLAQLAASAPLLAVCPNVLLYRDRPQDITKTPFLYLRTEDDDAEDAALGYPTLEDINAHFELSIVTHAIQANDYEGQALNIRREVEAVIYPAGAIANTLGGKVVRLMRTAARVEQDDLGGKPVYAIHLSIAAQIRHLSNQPDSFIY